MHDTKFWLLHIKLISQKMKLTAFKIPFTISLLWHFHQAKNSLRVDWVLVGSVAGSMVLFWARDYCIVWVAGVLLSIYPVPHRTRAMAAQVNIKRKGLFFFFTSVWLVIDWWPELLRRANNLPTPLTSLKRLKQGLGVLTSLINVGHAKSLHHPKCHINPYPLEPWKHGMLANIVRTWWTILGIWYH